MIVDPLSYSSSNDLLGCQQKYVYRKVKKVEIDSDASNETLAMDLGSVLHACLESCFHDLTGFSVTTLEIEMDKLDVGRQHKNMLWAMLKKYKGLHDKVGMKCTVVETEIKTPEGDFIGYIDAIFEDEGGGWWITDLKTAARINTFLPHRLHRDRQLNLYAEKYDPTQDNLDPEKFRGCRYRVVTKSKLKRRKDDTDKEYVQRMHDNIIATEYVIPKELLDPKEISKDFKSLRSLQSQLFKGTKRPIRNYGNCDSYFRPCEYWSQCHGRNFSEEKQILETTV